MTINTHQPLVARLHKLSNLDVFITPVCRYVVISIFSNTEGLVHKYTELCMFYKYHKALYSWHTYLITINFLEAMHAKYYIAGNF